MDGDQCLQDDCGNSSSESDSDVIEAALRLLLAFDDAMVGTKPTTSRTLNSRTFDDPTGPKDVLREFNGHGEIGQPA